MAHRHAARQASASQGCLACPRIFILALLSLGIAAPGCRPLQLLREQNLADAVAATSAANAEVGSEHTAASAPSAGAPAQKTAESGKSKTADEATTPSLEKLQQMATSSAELTRLAAISGLAQRGAWVELERAAADKSWRVRRAVATSLATTDNTDRGRLALALVMDRSVEVQNEVIRAVAQWPLAERGPVLLTAMGLPTYLPRQQAAQQLAAAWPAAQSFEIDADVSTRAGALAELQVQWRQEFPRQPPGAMQPSPASAMATRAKFTDAQWEKLTAEIDALRRQPSQSAGQGAAAALQATLKTHGAAALPALEELVFERGLLLPERVYTEVLPAIEPHFRHLNSLLTSESGEARRVAAKELKRSLGQRSLSRLAVERLSGHILRENDAIVWQCVLDLLAPDGRETAARIAVAGLTHPAAEVRRRACAHFVAHPDDSHAAALLVTAADPVVAVAIAAIEALRQIGPANDPSPVEQRLADGDRDVRLEAAITLSRWRVASGNAALERLVIDNDPRIRRKAALAIGETGDASLAPALTPLLEDRLDIRQAAEASLAKLNLPQAQPGAATSAAAIGKLTGKSSRPGLSLDAIARELESAPTTQVR